MKRPSFSAKISFENFTIAQKMAALVLITVVVLLVAFFIVFRIIISNLQDYMVGQSRQRLSLMAMDMAQQILSMQTSATMLMRNEFVDEYISAPTAENRAALQALVTRNSFVALSLGDKTYNNNLTANDLFSLGSISGFLIASVSDASYVRNGTVPSEKVCETLIDCIQAHYNSDGPVSQIALPQELYDEISGLCYVFPLSSELDTASVASAIEGYIILFASRYYVLKNMAKYYDKDVSINLLDREGHTIWCSGQSWSEKRAEADVCSVSTQLSNIDWTLELSVPIKSITSQLRTYWAFFILIVLLILAIYGMLIRFFSKSIAARLREMIGVITDVREGNTDRRYPVVYHDEISQIGEEFNSMIEQLQKYHINMAIAELRHKEAELHVLQSQINPHFLYNSLDCIRSAALVNHDQKAARQVQVLANTLRYTISNQSAELVPISAEVDHIYDYLTMLSFRFEDRYNVDIQISDEILPLKTLKLILQPIVENAFTHGLRHISSGGAVAIIGRLEHDSVLFVVEDNGCGIEKNRLEQLQAMLSGSPLSERNAPFMGLVNIHDRLRLAFGSEYGIQVESAPGRGTKVTMRLPIVFGKG